MDAVERVWHKDFNNLANAIPQSWILTDEDGLMWISADHNHDPLVELYRNHCIVGYARGWMP